MDTLEIRNQKIIDAVIAKERAVCPGALALIGIYGSFLTGEVHPLSDLDLMIVINDDRGWKLGAGFIQDDLGVGHDIYCTTWDSLREDAAYTHPHIAKLMDARLVYCADEKYRRQLEELRDQARSLLSAPFAEADYQRAEAMLKEAKVCCAMAMLAESLEDIRAQAGGVIYYAENAVALLNKTYFRRGLRRRYEELSAMPRRPEALCDMIESVVSAPTAPTLRDALTRLTRALDACFREARPENKKPAGAETLSGTYEEMFSNWHGKMRVAAETNDRYLAFTSLSSLHEMLADIHNAVDVPPCQALSAYDPDDLQKTAAGFDELLRHYLREYEKAGLRARRYPDVDAFVEEYLKEEGR